MSSERQAPLFEKVWEREGIASELRAANAIAARIWKVELSYPLSVLWFILMPFVFFIPMLIAGSAVSGGPESIALGSLAGTTDWISYIAIGASFSGLAMSMFWGTGLSLRREQNAGTLETLLTTPMRRDTMVLGSTIHNIQHGGLGVILQLSAAVFLFGASINAWGILPALGIIALSIIGLQGIVFALTCIVLLAKQGWMIIEFVSSTLMLVAPLSYPIAVLHPILQYISVASPVTWSVEGFRSFLMYGLAAPGIATAVVALIILDIIFVLFGVLMFKYTERYVRRKGALAQF
ncbi:MAG: ABC transporter permease [Candidatus Thorarchaeota archaeon]|jgi:ABC-2 type transport system permease protein